MEQNKEIFLGDNGITFQTPKYNNHNPDSIYVGNSQLYHIGSQDIAHLNPGDFVVSPRLGHCQAVFFEETGGRQHLLHNYAWHHFDIPPGVARHISQEASTYGAVVNMVRIFARSAEHIHIIGDAIAAVLDLPYDNIQVGIIPSNTAGFPVRVWGHADLNGGCAHKITTDDGNSIPIRMTTGNTIPFGRFLDIFGDE